MFSKLVKMVAVMVLSGGLAMVLTTAGCTDDSGNPTGVGGHMAGADGGGTGVTHAQFSLRRKTGRRMIARRRQGD